MSHERDSYLSQIQVLSAKNEQLTSENATLITAKKSLDLTVRAYDERMNLEKRKMQSQAAAQFAAARVEQSTLLSQLQTQVEEAIHDLSGLIAEDLSQADLKTVVAAVETSFENAKRSQLLYLELLEDVSDAQKALAVPSTAKVGREMRALLEKKAAVERQLGELERKVQQDQQEVEQARRDMKRMEQQVVALKLWESWGQRVHRVIHDIDAAELNGKDLRLILEESLLSSVSHRVVSTRLESLRMQKMVLMKFDKKLLTTKLPLRGGFRSITIICMFARRIQRISGHLPLSIGLQRVETFSESSSAKPRVETPRKRRSGRSKSVKRNSGRFL
jgi:hypothetical protein